MIERFCKLHSTAHVLKFLYLTWRSNRSTLDQAMCFLSDAIFQISSRQCITILNLMSKKSSHSTAKFRNWRKCILILCISFIIKPAHKKNLKMAILKFCCALCDDFLDVKLKIAKHWREKIWNIASLKKCMARPRVDRLLRQARYKNLRTCAVERNLQKCSTMSFSILNFGANTKWFAILKWPILVYLFLLLLRVGCTSNFAKVNFWENYVVD